MRLESLQVIDRIVALNLAERTIRAEATVPLTSPVFDVHFPGHPLVPGVLLIEAMAHAGAWIVIAVTRFTRMPLLAAVKEAKLRTFVRPGQVLTLSAELLHEGSGFAVTRAKVEADGAAACNAEIMLRLMEFPTAELKTFMQDYARRIGFPLGACADG
jgi:3-hydroxyacyl-[acyl-carrier-protein] dehydratase